MTFSSWFRSPRIRRGVAVSAVVLATGGLVLHRADANAFPGGAGGVVSPSNVLTAGKSSASFAGPGLHGMISLSHTKVLASRSEPVFADIRVVADAEKSRGQERAPISLAVVLDTSGSMSGEKIQDAKQSVLRLLADMRDDDEIALVRYDDRSELVQPLSRVGLVRASLTARIREIQAEGGTNIPGGLSHGLRALDEAARGRVKRIVLVSDGLDSTRAQAENLARSSFSSGITVSSLGVGLDFDESYMGSLAQNGHGNFAFVKDGDSIASFLKRELVETSTTTVESVHVRLTLPPGVRFVSATGADASVIRSGSGESGNEVELAVGAMFSGDQRRIVVEMRSDLADNTAVGIGTQATWNVVGGGGAKSADASSLRLTATNDEAAVESGRDGAVLASAMSVLASKRQVEAASAYASGDVRRAADLAAQNEAALAQVRAIAPPAATVALDSQLKEYREQKRGFLMHAPRSAEGRAAAKAGTAKDMSNLNRSTF